MTPMGSREHIYIYVSLQIGRTDQHRILGHPVLPNFPSGGTCFPTVKNAFLEGDLEEQVYMVQPLVF